MYSYFENVRLQPTVKLKIDMLNTSMGSCLDARVRKNLRSLLLKLFSCCLIFIVYENFKRNSVPHHETLAGFFSTSFEGEKQKWQCDGW
jgi:hypothetical protein